MRDATRVVSDAGGLSCRVVAAASDRRLADLNGLVLIVAASLVGVACSGGDDAASTTRVGGSVPTTTVPEPATTGPTASLPPLEVPASDVSAWLSGDGAALREVRQIGFDVLAAQGAFTVESCTEWVQELAGGPAPEQLVETAGTAPDLVIGDALGGAVIALNRVLSRCTKGESPDAESLGQLQSQLALADEREASL